MQQAFAHLKDLWGLVVRTIGVAREKVNTGMANLAYNMRRFLWLSGKNTEAWDAEAAMARHASSPESKGRC